MNPKRRNHWLDFLKEDNGNFSSMRLVLVGTYVQVIFYQLASIYFPHLQDQAIPFYSYAGAVVGMKAFQKTREEHQTETTDL
jgi:hypothetical protein